MPLPSCRRAEPVRSSRLALLFDIDGTLLWTDRSAGTEALHSAWDEHGLALSVPEGYSFGGKTDPLIVRELAAAGSLDADAALLESLLKAYRLHALPLLHAGSVQALDGAGSLLGTLAERRPGWLRGLVTGNIEPVGLAKVAAAGLSPLVGPMGAFGSDAEDRRALPPLALRRMSASDCPAVVIGDTDRDIDCATANGLYCVAIAHNPGERSRFEHLGAHLVVESLDAQHDDIIDFLDSIAE